MNNVKLKAIIQGLFLVFVLTELFGCTGSKPSRSKISIQIPEANRFRATMIKKPGTKSKIETATLAPMSSTAMTHIIVNLRVSGESEPRVIHWDACDGAQGATEEEENNCEIAQVQTQNVEISIHDLPPGPAVIQILGVLENTESGFGFIYDDKAMNLEGGDQQVALQPSDVIDASQTASLRMAKVAGRYFGANGETPSGRIDIMYQPPGADRAPMTIDKMDMIAGWVDFFVIEGMDFRYRMRPFSGGAPFDLGNGAINYNSASLQPSNSLMKAILPETYYEAENHGPNGTQEIDQEDGLGEEDRFGFFGPGATSKTVCYPNSPASLINGYGEGLFSDSEAKIPLSWDPSSTSRQANVMGRQGGVEESQCSGNEFEDHLFFDPMGFAERGSEGAIGLEGVFKMFPSPHGYETFAFVSATSPTNLTAEFYLLPGVDQVVQGVDVILADNLSHSVEDQLHRMPGDQACKYVQNPVNGISHFNFADLPVNTNVHNLPVTSDDDGNGPSDLKALICPFRLVSGIKNYISGSLITHVDIPGGGCHDCGHGGDHGGPPHHLAIHAHERVGLDICHVMRLDLQDENDIYTSVESGGSHTINVSSSNGVVEFFNDHNCDGNSSLGSTPSFPVSDHHDSRGVHINYKVTSGNPILSVDLDGAEARTHNFDAAVPGAVAAIKLEYHDGYLTPGKCARLGIELYDNTDENLARTTNNSGLTFNISSDLGAPGSGYDFYTDHRCTTPGTSVNTSGKFASEIYIMLSSPQSSFQVTADHSGEGISDSATINDANSGGEDHYDGFAIKRPFGSDRYDLLHRIVPEHYTSPSDCVAFVVGKYNNNVLDTNSSESVLVSIDNDGTPLPIFTDGACSAGPLSPGQHTVSLNGGEKLLSIDINGLHGNINYFLHDDTNPGDQLFHRNSYIENGGGCCGGPGPMTLTIDSHNESDNVNDGMEFFGSCNPGDSGTVDIKLNGNSFDSVTCENHGRWHKVLHYSDFIAESIAPSASFTFKVEQTNQTPVELGLNYSASGGSMLYVTDFDREPKPDECHSFKVYRPNTSGTPTTVNRALNNSPTGTTTFFASHGDCDGNTSSITGGFTITAGNDFVEIFYKHTGVNRDIVDYQFSDNDGGSGITSTNFEIKVGYGDYNLTGAPASLALNTCQTFTVDIAEAQSEDLEFKVSSRKSGAEFFDSSGGTCGAGDLQGDEGTYTIPNGSTSVSFDYRSTTVGNHEIVVEHGYMGKHMNGVQHNIAIGDFVFFSGPDFIGDGSCQAMYVNSSNTVAGSNLVLDLSAALGGFYDGPNCDGGDNLITQATIGIGTTQATVYFKNTVGMGPDVWLAMYNAGPGSYNNPGENADFKVYLGNPRGDGADGGQTYAGGNVTSTTYNDGTNNRPFQSYAKVHDFPTSTSLVLSATPGGTDFMNGDEVMLLVSQAGETGQCSWMVGMYEILRISTVTGSTITTTNFSYFSSVSGTDLQAADTDPSHCRIQMVRIPNFASLVINSAFSPPVLVDGVGGVIAFRSGSYLTLNAPIDVTGLGYKGGISTKEQGAGTLGPGGEDLANNFSGGGSSSTSAGGGGANAGSGGDADMVGGEQAEGGRRNDYCMYGQCSPVERLLFGGGGGAGGQTGGNGGGIAFIAVLNINGNGTDQKIFANGTGGVCSSCNGEGGGAGGSVYLRTFTMESADVAIHAEGGAGNLAGGSGGGGSIKATHCSGAGGISTFSGSMSPSGSGHHGEFGKSDHYPFCY